MTPRRLMLSTSYPFDRIKRLYDINVHGAFFTAREAARHMIPLGGGAIVLVASMSANVSASSSAPSFSSPCSLHPPTCRATSLTTTTLTRSPTDRQHPAAADAVQRSKGGGEAHGGVARR